MTFSLRRKRPTTRRPVPSIRTATALSLALAGWLTLAGAARAQDVLAWGVQWQTAAAGPRREMPAPTPLLRPASFQKKVDAPAEQKAPEKGTEKAPGGEGAQFPPSREPARSGSNPLGTRGKFGTEDDVDFVIQTELPGLDRLTQRLSEAQFYTRIEQESRRRPASPRVHFPEPDQTPREPYLPRAFPPMVQTVEPAYVCHRRLYFEQPNFERHGWDLGPVTPAVNLAVFYYDTLMFPYHYWSRPCDRIECNAGKCLPGDPTPLLLYREKFSVTGLVGQTGAVVGGIFAFP